MICCSHYRSSFHRSDESIRLINLQRLRPPSIIVYRQPRPSIHRQEKKQPPCHCISIEQRYNNSTSISHSQFSPLRTSEGPSFFGNERKKKKPYNNNKNVTNKPQKIRRMLMKRKSPERKKKEKKTSSKMYTHCSAMSTHKRICKIMIGRKIYIQLQLHENFKIHTISSW